MADVNNAYVEAVSVAGVATAAVASMNADMVQVSVKSITGTVAVTITAFPMNGGAFETVADGTITLSAPTTLLIEGRLHSVKATAASASPTAMFTLVVTKAG